MMMIYDIMQPSPFSAVDLTVNSKKTHLSREKDALTAAQQSAIALARLTTSRSLMKRDNKHSSLSSGTDGKLQL